VTDSPPLEDWPPPWFIVTSHFEDAEFLREIGRRAAAVSERARLDVELPRGPGSEVLLVGAPAQAIAGDLYRAGVAECWGAHVPIGYACLAHFLHDRAAVADALTDGVAMLDLLRLVEDVAFSMKRGSVPPTSHPDAPQPLPHGGRRLQFLSPFELGQMKARDWIVRRWLARGELAMLFGGWGTFKSFLALHLAVAVADGSSFLGHPCTPGLVVMLCGEGGGGMANRLRAAVGVSRIADPADSLHARLRICSEIPPLTDALGWERTVRAIDAMPTPPALLIVDTWARCMAAAGLDENRQSEAGAMVAAIDRLRTRFPGIATGVVHHTPHDRSDRARGSGALPAAVDLAIGVAIPSGLASLECKLWVDKIKDGKQSEPLIVSFAEAIVGTDEDGDVRSLYVSGFRPETASNTDEAAAELRAVLDILRERGRQPAVTLITVMRNSRSARYEQLRRWAIEGLLVRDAGGRGKADHYRQPPGAR